MKKKRDVDAVVLLKREVEREMSRRGIAFRWATDFSSKLYLIVDHQVSRRSAMAGAAAARERAQNKLERASEQV